MVGSTVSMVGRTVSLVGRTVLVGKSMMVGQEHSIGWKKQDGHDLSNEVAIAVFVYGLDEAHYWLEKA